MRAAGVSSLASAHAILTAAAELPRHHADPFERVSIAHALEADLGVLTRDPSFAAYGVWPAA